MNNYNQVVMVFQMLPRIHHAQYAQLEFVLQQSKAEFVREQAKIYHGIYDAKIKQIERELQPYLRGERNDLLDFYRFYMEKNQYVFARKKCRELIKHTRV